MTDFSIHLIFKFKQYKNTNIANFVYIMEKLDFLGASQLNPLGPRQANLPLLTYFLTVTDNIQGYSTNKYSRSFTKQIDYMESWFWSAYFYGPEHCNT